MRLNEDEKGASAVEFAIIASLLLMILFGTITFGIVFNRYQGLQAAGREGARLGSLATTTVAAIKTRVRDTVSIVNLGTTPTDCSAWVVTLETGCVLIQTKHDNNGDGDTTDSGETTDFTTPTSKPCNAAPSGQSVYVEVRYRLRIEIPLWAAPQMTVTGTGEFQCE